MDISKGWNWEVLSSDNEYWNTPDFMMHYLEYRWKDKNYLDFLDIGCGLGRHTIFMAKKGFRVHAFDYSKYVIDTVKQKLFVKGLEANLSVGDISSFPFENNSMDCMIAINILSNSDREGLKRILKEMHRVLRINGEVYFNIISKISDFDVNNDELFNGNNFYNIVEEDFEKLFENFEIISIKHVEEVGKDLYDGASYCVLLKKVDKNNSYNDNKIGDSAFLI